MRHRTAHTAAAAQSPETNQAQQRQQQAGSAQEDAFAADEPLGRGAQVTAGTRPQGQLIPRKRGACVLSTRQKKRNLTTHYLALFMVTGMLAPSFTTMWPPCMMAHAVVVGSQQQSGGAAAAHQASTYPNNIATAAAAVAATDSIPSQVKVTSVLSSLQPDAPWQHRAPARSADTSRGGLDASEQRGYSGGQSSVMDPAGRGGSGRRPAEEGQEHREHAIPPAPPNSTMPAPAAASAATGPQNVPGMPNLPRRSCQPLGIEPFVFFHQRKTAGAAMRIEIGTSVAQLNLSSSIECVTATCHAHLHERRNWNHQVLAGHYTWGHVFSDMPTRDIESLKISCVTMFRQPAARVRSCYYYTFQPTLIRWSQLTPKQLKQVLSMVVGVGCINEPLRIFSGYTYEQALMNPGKWLTLTRELINLSAQHMSKCLILMQEEFNDDITVKLLRYWVPWLNHTRIHDNVTPNTPVNDLAMTPEQKEALNNTIWPEMELYELARKQYARQIEHLRTVNVDAPCE